jgi:hypothetical protein
VGAWIFIKDENKKNEPPGGTRTWASLKYYEENSAKGVKIPDVKLKEWTKDIAFFNTSRTDFRDFPGLLVPAGLPRKGASITSKRTYYIMVLGISKDGTKVLSAPLESIVVSLDITVTEDSVTVTVTPGKAYADPPKNWAELLGKTPVEKLP